MHGFERTCRLEGWPGGIRGQTGGWRLRPVLSRRWQQWGRGTVGVA